MSPVHPIAQRGFGSDGERYEAARPGYPAESVDWLIERLEIDALSTVLDVGAGTGKLTRRLRPTGCRLFAVEPVTAMSDVLAGLEPAIEIITSTADDLPFPDGSVDAITVAQALHWFDGEDTWFEFARVLRRGGGVGLIWNARDRSVGWVDRVWSILDEVEKTAPWRDHDRPAEPEFGGARESFGSIESRSFTHDVTVDHQAMVDRIASVSHVAVLPVQQRQAVLDRVRRALPDRAHLTVRYRTDVYAVHRT